VGQTADLVDVADGRADELAHLFEVLRRLDEAPARPRVLPREADVLRDLVEPRRLELGHDAALEAAESVQERRLSRVLRLLAVAELDEAVGEDLPAEALVEVTRALGGRVCVRRKRTARRGNISHRRRVE